MSGRFAVSRPTALKGGASVHYGPAGEDWCRRAVTLGSEALDIAVTNGLDVGVLLVDSALHHRLASRAGTEMLRAADGLAVERARLACADRAAHRRLRQLVAVAADPDGPVGSVAVPRPSGARPYLLTVMPLRDERAWLGTPARVRARPRHRRRALPAGDASVPVQAVPPHGRRGAHGAGAARGRAAA